MFFRSFCLKVTDHPNILRLLEIFEDVRPLVRVFQDSARYRHGHLKDKNLFLVTELCGAGDLWRHDTLAPHP